MVVILAQDLMMVSNVRKLAQERGWQFRSVGTLTQLIQTPSVSPIDFLLVDLQLPGLKLTELADWMNDHNRQTADPSDSEIDPPNASAESRSPVVIGYAQHVYADLLSQARKMGLDRVVTRGQIMNGLDGLLTEE